MRAVAGTRVTRNAAVMKVAPVDRARWRLRAAHCAVLCALSIAGCAPAADEAKGHGGWQSIVVDRVGWVGGGAPGAEGDEAVGALLYDARIWALASADSPVLFLAYYPSPSGLAQGDTRALRLCQIAIGDDPQVLSTTTIDTDLYSDDMPLFGGTWGQGGCLAIAEGRPFLWHYSPPLGRFVRRDITGQRTESWEVPEEIRPAGSVQMSAEPGGQRVHFVAGIHSPEENRWVYGVLDADSGDWHWEPMPGEWPWLVSAGQHGVELLRVGRSEVEMYERTHAAGDTPARPNGTGTWGREEVLAVRGALTEYALAPDRQVLVAGGERDDLFEVFLLSEGNAGRGKELIASGPWPEHVLSLWRFAPSVAQDPLGGLHAGFFDPSAQEAKHCWREGDSWRVESVASASLVGSTAMAVSHGKVLMAYVLAGEQELVLSWRPLEPRRGGAR